MIRQQNHERSASFVTPLIFAMTGIGVVLPGSLLPVLLVRWKISDERAGYLFLAFFLTSTSGALLARGSLLRSVARGCGLIALGMASLAFVSSAVAFLAVAAYGLGLGITMTSVSLWQSRRYALERTARMARLNLLWAVGACAGPFIVLRGAAEFGEAQLLCSVALIFACLGIFSLTLAPAGASEPQTESQSSFRQGTVPGILFLLVPLATGIESSAGGWLATYSNRTGHDLGMMITTVTCFWGGMLASRFAQSFHSIATASTRIVLRLSPLLIAFALALLLDARNSLEGTLAAFILGAAVGPLYPLLIALFLNFGEAGNIVFVLGGVGAALFPWLTGLVSTRTHSLRSGLTVLFLGSIFLGLLAWRASLGAWTRPGIHLDGPPGAL
jgi:fucose permease